MDPYPSRTVKSSPLCQPPVEPEYAAGLVFLAITGMLTTLSIIVWAVNQ